MLSAASHLDLINVMLEAYQYSYEHGMLWAVVWQRLAPHWYFQGFRDHVVDTGVRACAREVIVAEAM